jgi:pilus assembly protein CpaE
MDKAVTISLEKMEEAIQKPIEWVFPNDFLNATESVNTGIPIEKLQPNIPLSRAFNQMAREIAGITLEESADIPWYKKWL